MKRIYSFVFAFIAGIAGAFVYNYFFIHPSNTVRVVESVSDSIPVRYSSQKNVFSEVPDFVIASKNSTNSVVYIKTITESSVNNYSWFDLFFGGGGYAQKSVSSGSGVIYSKDGYIITNNHVIDGADRIQVIHDNRTYEAKLIGNDPSTDLAILKVDGEDMPSIKIGSSKDLEVGSWVLAVGNPFNLTSTVTAGIVSARGRNINILEGAFPIESFIQTDAAINPGNSGGALVDESGLLVGINTAILSKTGSYAGYGFAVPVDIVKKTVDDLIQYGEVQKVFIGAEVADVDYSLATKLNAAKGGGVVVTFLQNDGVAKKSGLKQGDIIRKINNEKIKNQAYFDETLSYFNPGDKVKVQYERDGELFEVDLVLTNKEGTTEILKRELFASKFLGADLENVSKVEREKLGIDNGVRVIKVNGGVFERIGLPEGFTIVQVNRYKVKDAKDLISVLEKLEGRVLIQGINKSGSWKYYSYYY